MNVADLAAVVSIVGAVIGTTFIVVAKLTRVEVMLTQIQSEMKRYEARIAALERRSNERQP
jgi:uncharacterized membrane protein YciS (DUF1049 family)